jgi:hypothetical protein
MDWQEMLHAFQFENDFILDDQIQPIPTVQLDPLVFDRQRNLALKSEPA